MGDNGFMATTHELLTPSAVVGSKQRMIFVDKKADKTKRSLSGRETRARESGSTATTPLLLPPLDEPLLQYTPNIRTQQSYMKVYTNAMRISIQSFIQFTAYPLLMMSI